MAMNLESRSREAFELVTDALECLDKYRESREVDELKLAKTKLEAAKIKDPLYFRAHYFDAIVDDLSGRSKTAVATLSRLLEEKPPFAEEVQYNLGVSSCPIIPVGHMRMATTPSRPQNRIMHSCST